MGSGKGAVQKKWLILILLNEVDGLVTNGKSEVFLLLDFLFVHHDSRFSVAARIPLVLGAETLLFEVDNMAPVLFRSIEGRSTKETVLIIKASLHRKVVPGYAQVPLARQAGRVALFL